MHNDGELEPLFKAIEENHKENGYVTKALKKYLPFIFIEDNVLKIKFKNKVLLVVPKSLRYKIRISLDILYNYHKEPESIPLEQFKDNLNKSMQ